MDTTRASLLMRVKDPEDTQAWQEFDALYRPLLVRYTRSRGLSPADADDVAQESLVVVMRKIGDFEYDRPKGGFKRWLRAIANKEVLRHLRKPRPPQPQSADFRRPQESERTPEQAWELIWLQEHLKFCLEQIRSEIEPQTYETFRRHVIDEWSVQKVCGEVGVNANQVYIAKMRVGHRLREKMIELLGDQV